jgi:hypothetical protein
VVHRLFERAQYYRWATKFARSRKEAAFSNSFFATDQRIQFRCHLSIFCERVIEASNFEAAMVQSSRRSAEW